MLNTVLCLILELSIVAHEVERNKEGRREGRKEQAANKSEEHYLLVCFDKEAHGRWRR
jgi:hypothetical protein